MLLITSFKQQIPSDFSKISLTKNSKKQIIFVIFDYGCGFCEKTLIFHIDKLPFDKRAMILYSKQKKIRLSDTIYEGHLKQENFALSNSEEIFSLVTKKTNDFKGPFVIEVENNRIVAVKTLNESIGNK